MTDTLAYQIGAVFFLAVLFMAGTLTSGLFPKGVFKTVKLSMLVMAALLVGFVAYRRLPDISTVPGFTSSRPTQIPAERVPAPGLTIKQSDAPRPATKIRKVQIIQQAAPAPGATPEPQEIVPAADPPSTVLEPQTEESPPPSSVGESSAPVQSWRVAPVQESGNRVKQAIKSVGHFLHLGHDKYRPGPSIPQPAVAP
jgi:hypothetical protein